MDVLHPQVAGLDLHKESVVACVRVTKKGKVERECRTFGTTTEALTGLSAWLSESLCTHVAMEATGVYWKPVWKILGDGEFDLIVANAAHIKNVPGRKTDMNDAMWIADLMACGLIKSSFIPEEKVEELRTLARTRKQTVRDQTQQVQRIQKILTEANIKLDSVVTDIMGVSSRRIINAMIGGESDPKKLAALVTTRLKASPDELHAALHGRLTDAHRFLLEYHTRNWDYFQASLNCLDKEIDSQLNLLDQEAQANEKPSFRAKIRLLETIPGISTLSAITILSEIGSDMTRFPTAGHLVSWAGLCPGQNESAGKRKSTRLRKGAPWLKTVLVQSAWAATRKRNSYLRAQFHRLRSKRGPKRAVCAVAASILTSIYHMLKNGTPYEDLGEDHFDRRATKVKANFHVAKLKKLGFSVTIEPIAKAA